MRIRLVACLTLRSSGIAFVVKTSNAEAHADMQYLYINKYIGVYYIPMDVIVALLIDYKFRNCQIPERQEQSVK